MSTMDLTNKRLAVLLAAIALQAAPSGFASAQEPTPARRSTSAGDPTPALRGPKLADDPTAQPSTRKRKKSKKARKEPSRLAPADQPKLRKLDGKDEASATEAKDDDEQQGTASGREIVLQAYELTKSAANEVQYSEVIDICRKGLQAGVNRDGAAYARKLMAWAYNRRGEARAKAGKDPEALEDFEAAVDLDDKHWRAVHNRGVSYATLGDYKRATQDFNRTIEMNPNYPNAHFNRGELRYEAGNLQEAIEDYTRAIELAPNDAAAYNSRGHAQYRLGQYRSALDDYNAAVRLDPENAAAYTNRGDAYADQGFYAQAARDYQTAIQYDPKLGRAYQSAAWLMATCPREQFRDTRLAMNAAQKAIELDGESDYRYLETLAAAQANAGEFAQAKDTQRRVIKMVPRSVLARHKERLNLYEREQAYREGQSEEPGPSYGVSQRGE